MCVMTNDGRLIYDGRTAREFLEESGIDPLSFDEFLQLMRFDDLDELKYRYESLVAEFKSYELSLDTAQGLLNDLLNLCDERIGKERTQAGRNAYATIRNMLASSEVF